MNKTLALVALAFSSLLLGCPDNANGVKPAPSTPSAMPANAPAQPGAPAAPSAAPKAGGGW